MRDHFGRVSRSLFDRWQALTDGERQQQAWNADKALERVADRRLDQGKPKLTA